MRDGFSHGERCGKSKLGCDGRLRAKQQRREEIAPLRHPGTAAPTTPRRLFVCHDPKRSVLAAPGQPACFLICGIQRVANPQAEPFGPAGDIAHGKSAAAALAAELTSGPAPSTKKSVNIPAAPMMEARLTPMSRSKAGAGSSKYISFTIRK